MPKVSTKLKKSKTSFKKKPFIDWWQVNHSLAELTEKTITFLLPIALFKLGAELPSFLSESQITQGFLVVGLFYGFSNIVSLISSVLTTKYINRYGISKSYTYSCLCKIIMYCVLFFSVTHPALIVVATFLDAIARNLYWNTYGKYQQSTFQHITNDIRFKEFLIIASIAALPALAGFFTEYFSLEVLFLLTSLLTLAQYLVSLQLPYEQQTENITITSFISFFKQFLNSKQATFNQSREAFLKVMVLVWPVYLYIKLGTFEKVGLLRSLSLLLVLTMFIFIGKRKYKAHLTTLERILLSTTWLIKAKANNFFYFAVADSVDTYVQYTNEKEKRSPSKSSNEFAEQVYLYMIQLILAALFWFICIGVVLTTTAWWEILSFIAAGTVLSTLIVYKKYE